MARYHIETYGCTLNRGEGRAIESALRDTDHYRVDGPGEVDVTIMNTCTVVEETERNILRRVKELVAEMADLIITGCMVLAQGNDFRGEGIDTQILHWDDVPAAATNGECPAPSPGVEPALDGVVGILPIIHGCTPNCSYCTTKFTIGRVDSLSVDENVEEARALVHVGAKKLRVTGQDTGVYGWNNDDQKLPELLDRICTEIGGELRIRVGMANPDDVRGIRDELAMVFARHDKFYNFIHAPVQSDSDEALEHMRHQRRVDRFRKIVETFDRELSYRTLSTDLIVGYPTETDADHKRSMKLLHEVHPEKVSVTCFSKRPGADTTGLKGLGETPEKGRSKEMSEAKMDIVATACDKMAGTEHDVLVVEEGTSGSMECRDEAYRQIIVQDATEYGLGPGNFAHVTMTAHQTVYVFAEPVEAQPEPREPTII